MLLNFSAKAEGCVELNTALAAPVLAFYQKSQTARVIIVETFLAKIFILW